MAWWSRLGLRLSLLACGPNGYFSGERKLWQPVVYPGNTGKDHPQCQESTPVESLAQQQRTPEDPGYWKQIGYQAEVGGAYPLQQIIIK
jgi:hypothetical protein